MSSGVGMTINLLEPVASLEEIEDSAVFPASKPSSRAFRHKQPDTRDALALSERKRDARDWREKRDGSEVSSLRVAPVAHVLLVSLTIHKPQTKRTAFLNSPLATMLLSCEP